MRGVFPGLPLEDRMKSLNVMFALACLAACGGGGSNSGTTSPYGGGGTTTTGADQNPAPTTPNTINANPGLAYNPTSLTVSSGTTVTFSFGAVGHSITFNTSGAPADVPVTSNANVTRVFSTTGVFNFHCSVHTYMTGTITVQ
jgi:plastocyanin